MSPFSSNITDGIQSMRLRNLDLARIKFESAIRIKDDHFLPHFLLAFCFDGLGANYLSKSRSPLRRAFELERRLNLSANNANARFDHSTYTQWIQMSPQPISELQNTERELVDALQTMSRDSQTFWESYAGMRDQEHQTNERVMTLR